jgi:hypothetical protein
VTPPSPVALRAYFAQRHHVRLADAPWDDDEAWQAALDGRPSDSSTASFSSRDTERN